MLSARGPSRRWSRQRRRHKCQPGGRGKVRVWGRVGFTWHRRPGGWGRRRWQLLPWVGHQLWSLPAYPGNGGVLGSITHIPRVTTSLNASDLSFFI